VTAARQSFSKVEAKRLLAFAREQGFPVENMGLVVDGARIALLPAGVTAASVMDPVTDELEAFSKKHGYG
jgi:hypothetical protein